MGMTRTSRLPHSGIENQHHPIDVEVRLEWADDGEEWLQGRAWRWTRSHVFVGFVDPRSATGFVWVRARDVRRVWQTTQVQSGEKKRAASPEKAVSGDTTSPGPVLVLYRARPMLEKWWRSVWPIRAG